MNIGNRPRLYNLLHRLRLVAASSQTHPDERACLCRHIRNAKAAVEIGTYMGLTASEMAAALPQGGLLYCVDPYPGDVAIQQIALRTIERAGQSARIRMVRTDSAGAVAHLPAQVDFFFVDGDHSFEGLQRDWVVVKQLLKPGAIAAFHDTHRVPGATVHSEGAIRFYDEVIAKDPDFEPVETVLSLNVIRRKAA